MYLILLPIALIVYILSLMSIIYSSRYLFVISFRESDFKYTKMVINQNYSFFKHNDKGEILNIVKNIASDVAFFEASEPRSVITSLISIVCYAILFSIYSWILTIIVFTLIIVLVYLTSLTVKKINKYVMLNQENKGKSYKDFNELASNAFLIQQLNDESFFIDKYKQSYNSGYYKSSQKFQKYQGTYMLLYSTFIFLLPLAILIFGLIFKDALMITAGAVVAIYAIVGNLQEPLRGVSSFISEYKTYRANKKMLNAFFDTDCKNALPLLNEFSSIYCFSTEGITFANKNILKNLDFVINKNDFCLLTGESGSGKSTLLKHIVGMENDDLIKIEFDNINKTKIKLWPNCLLVTQDNHLFTDTIKNNILCSLDYDEPLFNEVISTCLLNDYVDKNGLYSVVDSESSNISGGEKSRICLARILIRKPKLLLVDEITASLDSVTSKQLAKNIFDFSKKYGITVICVSHKDEFNEYANKIYKL